jgi:hypothetical protein
VRLFHPRLHQWDDHFVLDPQTGRIRGVSLIGQATTNRLRFNSESQVEARRAWMALGLYP